MSSSLGNTQLLVGRAGGYSSNYTADISGSLYSTADAVFNGMTVGLGGGSITTNTALGTSAFSSNTAGGSNVAVGYGSLALSKSNYNTAVGANTLTSLSVTSSNNNTAFGINALSVTQGYLNTAVGSNSGLNCKLSTTSQNSFFGSGSGFDLSSSNWSCSTAIGYNSTITGSNQIVLGTSLDKIYVPGNVGIGTTNPAYPLHITGYNGSIIYYSPAIATYGLPSTGGQFGSANNLGLLTTIYSERGVYSGLGFIQASDKRIKENIEIVDVKNALSLLSKITPKTYTRADKLKYGSKREYGFIAQELETIIPECVTFSEETIPNIYDRATVSNGTIIELTTKSTNLFEKDASGNIFTKIKYYDASNNELTTNIVSIIDDKTFIVTDLIDSSFVFIFGQKVNNFRSLDKNMIFTITTAAVKEIDREFQEAKQTIQTQQSQIHELQTENTDLKTRLAAIEARLSAAGF